jgi:ATP-dependent helicase/DNAse subunit B
LAQLGFLPSADNAAREERFFFFNCVKRARRSLWLSASIAGGEIISSYLEDVARALPGLALLERPARAVLPAPDFLANEDVLASLLIDQKAAAPSARAWLDGYLGCDFSMRLAGELPRRAGVYAGGAAPVKENINSLFELSFTASLLENYALCPFKFLLEQVWRPYERPQAGDGLAPGLRGVLYHACLRKFIQKHLGRRLTDDAFPRLENELAADFDELLQEYAAKGLFTQTWLTGRECSDMKKELAGWLAAEINYQEFSGDFYPSLLEWKFDQQPLTLPVQAGEAKISGRIDRVDTDGAAYFVTDYKLGNFPKRGDVEDGLDLQIPIYLLAAERFLGPTLGGGYFSVGNAGRGGGFWTKAAKEKLPFAEINARQKTMGDDWPEYRRMFVARLTVIIDNIGAGNFPPLPGGGTCPGWCAGLVVCRKNRGGAEDADAGIYV